MLGLQFHNSHTFAVTSGCVPQQRDTTKTDRKFKLNIAQNTRGLALQFIFFLVFIVITNFIFSPPLKLESKAKCMAANEIKRIFIQ